MLNANSPGRFIVDNTQNVGGLLKRLYKITNFIPYCLLSGFAMASTSLPKNTIKITALPAVTKTTAPSPAQAGPRYVDDAYCNVHDNTFIVIAHADDDRYFFGGDIRSKISAGNCVKIIHINAGFDVKPIDAPEYHANDPYYYQGRIDGSKATYENLLSNGFSRPVYETDAWDVISGFKINRYIISTAMNGDKPSGQRIEIQEFGLPNSSSGGPSSGAGVTTSELYADYTKTSINIASLITKPSYNISSKYAWSDLVAMLNQITSWRSPTEMLTLDPYGVPNDDQHEGQHPDHIMAARVVLNSNFAKNNPSKVHYYKTYNTNDFLSNLNVSVAADSENDLGIHWLYDWGASWTTDTPCDNSMSDAGIQFSPSSWACKNYQANQGEYFIAGQIVGNIGGNKSCLNASDASHLTFGACGAASLQITIGYSNVAWVSNQSSGNPGVNTNVLYPQSLSSPLYVQMVDYSAPSSVTRWHFNDLTSQLEFQYKNSAGDRVILCLNSASDGKAILSSCSTAIKVGVVKNTNIAAGNIKVQYADNPDMCLGVSSGGASLVNCNTDPAANVILRANGSISNSAGTTCLKMPTFATGGAITTQSCNANSPGQMFYIQKIGASPNAIIHPMYDQLCLERDLQLYPCHAYHQQQWIPLAR